MNIPSLVIVCHRCHSVYTFLLKKHHFSKKHGGLVFWGTAPLVAPQRRKNKKRRARGHRQLAEVCYTQGTLEASLALAAAPWCNEIACFFVDVFIYIYSM